MKKTLLLFLSLAIILTIGIFTVKAVDYTTTGSFNFNNFNLNSYVQNEVYKYKCDAAAGTCSKVKVASINTSDYFDTESECKTKCKKTSASSYSYTDTGFNSLNFNSLSNNTDNKPAGSGNNYGTANTGGTASGLSGFNWTVSSAPTTTKAQYNVTQGTAISGLNFNNSVSGNNQTVQNNAAGLNNSTNFTTGSSLFGTGVTFKDQATPQVQQGTGNFFTNLLSGLGFGGQNDTISSGTDIAPNKFEVKVNPTEVKGKTEEEITITWDAIEKGYKSCLANSTPATGSDFTNGKDLGTQSQLKVLIKQSGINFRPTEKSEGKFKNIKFSIKCLAVTGESVTVSSDVKWHWHGTAEDTPQDSFTFSATSPVKDNEKSKLTWDATGFKSCETKAVGNTDWESNAKLSIKDSKEVSFKTAGTYKFTITCKPNSGTDVSKTVEVKYGGSSETEPKKGTLGDYSNDCSFKILSHGYVKNITNKDDAKEVTVEFSCKGKAGEISGHDVRPIRYGLFINERTSSGTKRYECDPVDSKYKGQEYLPKEGESVKLSCKFSDEKFEGLFVEGNNNSKMLLAFVEFYTNQTSGTPWPGMNDGVPRIDRINAAGAVPFETDKSQDPEDPIDPTDPKILSFVAKPESLNCTGGEVVFSWATQNLQTCSLVKSTGKIIKTALNDSTTKLIISKNDKNEDNKHTFWLICLDESNQQIKQEVNVTVKKCDSSRWEETCLRIKDKKQCSIQLGIGNQVQLTQDNSGNWSASDLIFSVEFSQGCEIGEFQKSFGRLVVDQKIIQDVALSNTTHSRIFEIKNIWEKLDVKTKENILRTINEKNPNGTDKYSGAKVNFYLEAWSTFDEGAGRKDGKVVDEWKSKNANCNWTEPPRKHEVKFIKNVSKKLPSDQPKDQENKPPEEEPKIGNKNFKGTGLALYFPQNELCRLGYAPGNINKYQFKQKASLFLMLTSIGATSPWEVSWAGIWYLNKDIVYLKPQDFETSSKETNERGWYINNSMKPGLYTLAIFCRDKNNIKGVTNEGAFGSSEYREFTVRENEMSIISIPGQIGGTLISKDSLDIKAEMAGRKDTIGTEVRVTLISTKVNDPDATCLVAIKGEKYDPARIQLRKTLNEMKNGAVIYTFMPNTTQDVYVQLRCFSGNTIYFSKTITKNIKQKITSDSGQVCKAGSPTFSYYKGTGELSSGIPCVSIDTSNCCFGQVIKAHITYLGRSAWDRNISGNSKKYSFCSTVNNPTDETGKTSEIKLCLASSQTMRVFTSGCDNYCIFRNKNGKTTAECNLEGDFMCR